MPSTPNLRPFFLYFGGKWRLAKRYPEPSYDTVIEPFAGAAGYSVRHHHRNVILCDLDEKVCGTWRYLIDASERDIRSLPLIEDGQSTDDLNVCDEARWLIGWWLNKGVAQPVKRPSKWMRDERYASQFWSEEIKDRIARQQAYIRHWQVINDTYENLSVDGPSTYFVDPPYAVAGKDYKHSDIDYGALADWCRSRRGQVIVCEGPDADWLPFSPFASAHAMSGVRRSGVSKEYIWEKNDAY